MNTTIETQLASHGVTIDEIPALVFKLAKRKSDNGDTLTTNKGKVSLFTACCGEVRSRLGLSEYVDSGDGQNGANKTRIEESWCVAIRNSIDSLVSNAASRILANAKEIGADVKIRENYLVPKFDDKKGSLDVSLKSSLITNKEQARNSKNFRFGVVMAIASAKKQIITIEAKGTSSGEKELETLAKAKRKLATSEAILAKLNETLGSK